MHLSHSQLNNDISFPPEKGYTVILTIAVNYSMARLNFSDPGKEVIFFIHLFIHFWKQGITIIIKH